MFHRDSPDVSRTLDSISTTAITSTTIQSVAPALSLGKLEVLVLLTFTLKLKVPTFVGLPEMVPLPAKVSPGGRTELAARTGCRGWLHHRRPRWLHRRVSAPGNQVAVTPRETMSRVKDCVASGETPFEAVMVMGKLPVWVGVPESMPVLPRSFKVTPVGSVPVSESEGGGRTR